MRNGCTTWQSFIIRRTRRTTVRICDKIMLMFGLGKYVDKAMELKLQYAPLTKYQMDLVENREKYEEKLRAVEEEYKNGTYRKPETGRREADTDEPEAELDDEPENEPEGQPEQAEPEEKAGKPKAETKPADEKVEKAALDEDVVASLHEAQAEEALAKEVSKIKPTMRKRAHPKGRHVFSGMSATWNRQRQRKRARKSDS